MSRTEHLKLFLNPGHRSPPDLGTVITLHTEGKKLCLAANILFHLLSNSHKPDGLAQEILHECEYTDSVRPIVAEIHADHGNNFLQPGTWANQMLDALPQVPIGSKDGAMPDVNRLAAHYLTHLCFAFWNPPGPSTPQVSTHPSPDIPQKVVIKELIRQSTDDHQMSTLKTLVELRDNKLKCPVSSSPFIPAVHGVVSELAHILPFSIHGKSETHKAIEMFTGMDIDAQTIIALVNRPENALLLDHDSHKAFDTMCSWGIEAYVDVNGTNRYFVRPIIPKQIPMHMLGYINREFILGDGIQGIGEEGNRIALPDPRLCNLKLNVMRVMHASGAADVFEEQKKNLLRTSIAQPCNLSFWALQWRWTKSFLTNST